MGTTRFPVIAGTSYGLWHVVRPAAERRGQSQYALCRCVCGAERKVPHHTLRTGKTKSCGKCPEGYAIRSAGQRRWRSSEKKSTWPEHHVWVGLRQRCKKHPRYAGRGITVFPAWKSSFDRFIADVGRRPSALHSLDRIDNDRGYEPGNVRWATKQEQANNRHNSRILTAFGKTQTLQQWANEVQISQRTLGARLYNGWTIERALTQPAISHNPRPWKRSRPRGSEYIVSC